MNRFHISRFVMSAALISLLGACSSVFHKGPVDQAALQEQRLDHLTQFSMLIGESQYAPALKMLADDERHNFFDEDGTLSWSTKERLSSIRLSTLLNDPSIHLQGGKLVGLYNRLNVYSTRSLSVLANVLITEPEPSPREREVLNVANPVELRGVWNKFMAAVDAGKFVEAVSYIHESEQGIFYSPETGLKEGVEARLMAFDRTQWSNLNLKDGKLERVWNFIPEAANPLENTAREFIAAIHSNHWGHALSMLSKYEREYLCDSRGVIKPIFKEALSELDDEEWDQFFLFRGKLTGALDYIGYGSYGMKK